MNEKQTVLGRLQPLIRESNYDPKLFFRKASSIAPTRKDGGMYCIWDEAISKIVSELEALQDWNKISKS